MAQARTGSRSSDRAGNALIGNATRIRGRISGEGDLTILGQVEGDIALRGNLTIGASGSASSDVEAADVHVAGNLEGEINASGQVRIGAAARIRGDVRGTGVTIEEGAQFDGRIDCDFDLPEELEQRSP